MLKNLAFPIKSYGDTDFVTGLRAYAALAVMLIHAGGAGLVQLHPLLAQLVFLGQTGVYVFFVISGFSVTASYRTTAHFTTYLSKRFMRIAPLYYVLLLGLFLLQPLTNGNMPASWDTEFGVKYDLYNLFMHLSFLSFLDYKITNSVIGVEWTLSIEMFWYILLPLLLTLVTNWQRALTLLIASIALYFSLQCQQEAATHIHTRHIFEWSPLFYACAFSLGVLAYYIRPLVSNFATKHGDKFFIALLVVGIAAFLSFAPQKSAGIPTYADTLLTASAFTFALIVLGTNQSLLVRALLLNRAALYLGTISYGLYLIHFPLVIFFRGLIENKTLLFSAVFVTTVLASHLSYRFIERPALKLIKKP